MWSLGGLPWWLRSKESATLETWGPSLGWEDALEKGMAILAWRVPWTEEPGGLWSTGLKESGTTERLSFHLFHRR